MIFIVHIAAIFFCITSIFANHTAWQECPLNPISLKKISYPNVIFQTERFNDDTAFYKMWVQAESGIQVAYSEDGIHWLFKEVHGLPNTAEHPVVIYDANGFEGVGFFYKIWFLDRSENGSDIHRIKFSQSFDGIYWESPISVEQDYEKPLVSDPENEYFQFLFGPSCVIFDSNKVPCENFPYSYPYVMFFETSLEESGFTKQIGLAYSIDGLVWTRYGNEPILKPSGNVETWHGHSVSDANVVKHENLYHVYYTGSNGITKGIGHGTSEDGIHWTLDCEPIFCNRDGEDWRKFSTAAPSIVYEPFCYLGHCSSCFAKMWFTGCSVENENVLGYASLSCPAQVAPRPPKNFVGYVQEDILILQWQPSETPSVLFYRIYKSGKLIDEVSALSPAIFIAKIKPKQSSNFEIAAVDSSNVESLRISLQARSD